MLKYIILFLFIKSCKGLIDRTHEEAVTHYIHAKHIPCSKQYIKSHERWIISKNIPFTDLYPQQIELNEIEKYPDIDVLKEYNFELMHDRNSTKIEELAFNVLSFYFEIYKKICLQCKIQGKTWNGTECIYTKDSLICAAKDLQCNHFCKPLCNTLKDKIKQLNICDTECDCSKWIERPYMCCKAMTASCLACADGITIDEYCKKYPQTSGCPVVCCEAMTASCLACKYHISVDALCDLIPNLDGC